MLKIAVVGLGYVGLSNSILLSRYHSVCALDIDQSRVSAVNSKQCPLHDEHMQHYLTNEALNLTATTDARRAYKDADYVIVATPTNYDSDKGTFDTSSVCSVIKQAKQLAPQALIIVKSTVPIGFTSHYENVLFSPEFLREGSALYDNLYPSRIVVGERSERAQRFALLLQQAAEASDVRILLTSAQEAEAIKLFSNSYLALRVAFFNELDSYAMHNDLDAKRIIEGLSLDCRIGDYYNNPSFGYGGYCLPKDSMQLLSQFEDTPQSLFSALVQSNEKRKQYIVDHVCSKAPKMLGIYRLVMKANSDNFRQSATHDVIMQLQKRGVQMLIYEPYLSSSRYEGIEVTPSLKSFKQRCDLILANRSSDDLKEVSHITRDIFNKD